MPKNFKYNLTFAFLNRILNFYCEIFLGGVFIRQRKGFEFWDKYLPLVYGLLGDGLWNGPKMSYLGGSDGALTWAKASWFVWLPRIHSPRVMMVSVKMSAGMPTAIKMWQNLSKRRHCWIVFWQLSATCIHKERRGK